MMGVALSLSLLRGSDDSASLPMLPKLVSAAGRPGFVPAQTVSGGSGLLIDADLILSTELPDAPSVIPVYRVRRHAPSTPEEALAWARDFGFSNARLYHDPRDSRTLVVLDNDRRLVFVRTGPVAGIHYRDESAMTHREGPPVSLERATEVAVGFLQEHDLLPEDYRVEEPEYAAHREDSPFRTVNVVPLVDGYPLMGDHGQHGVTVNPDGDVTYAMLYLLSFEPGPAYPVRTAQEAYADLTGEGSGAFALTGRRHVQPASDVRRYQPSPQPHALGDVVTVTGWVQVLVADPITGASPAGRSDVLARLTAPRGTYELTGQRVSELTEIRFDDVQVKGTIAAQRGVNRWEVIVDDWETVPDRVTQCLDGEFIRDGNGGWLVIDPDTSQPAVTALPDAERYRLPDAPADLQDGEQVEICAADWPSEGGTVDWLRITTPPTSEQGHPSSMVAESVAVEAVETTPAPTPTPVQPEVPTPTDPSREPQVHVVQAGETLQAIAGQYGVTVEALLAANDLPLDSSFSIGLQLVIPEPQAVSEVKPDDETLAVVPLETPAENLRTTPPFEIGQRVKITGVVRATIYVNGDDRHVEAQLADVEPDQTLPPYPLAGSQDLLEALAEHHPLHVRVWGEVIPAEQVDQSYRVLPANTEIAILLERFEKLWPGERVQGFLGHIELETLEGRRVAVFTDHETDQRYVVAQSLAVENFFTPGRDPLLDFEQIFVAGAVGSGRTYVDLPVMRFISSKGGPRTEAATSADAFPLNASPSVVREDETWSGRPQGAFVVDRVELAYYCEPSAAYPATAPDGTPLVPEPVEQVIQPVWIFHGRNGDGSETFTAYVQAVKEELVRDE
jgi:LysM repeat protein